MAAESPNTTQGAVLKQIPIGPKKAKIKRTFIIEPKTLVIAGFFLVAVAFAVIVGVRTFKGPGYPTSEAERTVEAKRVAEGASSAMAQRVAAGAAAKNTPGRK